MKKVNQSINLLGIILSSSWCQHKRDSRATKENLSDKISLEILNFQRYICSQGAAKVVSFWATIREKRQKTLFFLLFLSARQPMSIRLHQVLWRNRDTLFEMHSIIKQKKLLYFLRMLQFAECHFYNEKHGAETVYASIVKLFKRLIVCPDPCNSLIFEGSKKEFDCHRTGFFLWAQKVLSTRIPFFCLTQLPWEELILTKASINSRSK